MVARLVRPTAAMGDRVVVTVQSQILVRHGRRYLKSLRLGAIPWPLWLFSAAHCQGLPGGPGPPGSAVGPAGGSQATVAPEERPPAAHWPGRLGGDSDHDHWQ
jgi:hypothetical protein